MSKSSERGESEGKEGVHTRKVTKKERMYVHVSEIFLYSTSRCYFRCYFIFYQLV